MTRRTFAACAIGSVAALACIAGAAHAHARLKESVPKVGEVLQASPTEVRIIFTNDIQKIAGTYGIEVRDASQESVTTGAAVLDDDDRSLLTVELRPDLPAGRYVVQYKNVSDDDGDAFESGFAFYVGRQPTAAELALDEQLEPEEETPQATATRPSSGATPTALPPDVLPDGDDDGNMALVVVVVAVVAVALVAGGAALWWRMRAR